MEAYPARALYLVPAADAIPFLDGRMVNSDADAARTGPGSRWVSTQNTLRASLAGMSCSWVRYGIGCWCKKGSFSQT